jgi:hypothetical protein
VINFARSSKPLLSIIQNHTNLILVNLDPDTGKTTLIKDLTPLGVGGPAQIDLKNRCIYIGIMNFTTEGYSFVKLDFKGNVLLSFDVPEGFGPMVLDVNTNALYTASGQAKTNLPDMSLVDIAQKKLSLKFHWPHSEIAGFGGMGYVQSNATILWQTYSNSFRRDILSFVNTKSWKRSYIQFKNAIFAMKWCVEEEVLYWTVEDYKSNQVMIQRVTLPSMEIETLYTSTVYSTGGSNEYDPSTGMYYVVTKDDFSKLYLISLNTKTKAVKVVPTPFSYFCGIFAL